MINGTKVIVVTPAGREKCLRILLNLASKDWSYTRSKESWWILCYKCHRQYDLKNNWGLATKLFKL
jgi:hypothetical protein